MTLLTSMLERPLDPGYQDAADRREAAGLPRATSTRTVLVVLLAILTGFLFAVAAQSLRPKPTAAAALKQQLVSRIEAFQKHSTDQEARLAAVSKQVSDYEALALKQSGSGDLTGTIKQLEVDAATVPLTGPGLTLTIDDAPSTEVDGNAGSRPSSDFQQGQVTSGDLQIIVNGLWGAGAEAISINGHRLSSTAAIRFAGRAIIVDFRPLARPYVITALGDANAMQQLFEPSFAGVYLSELTHQYKIRSAMSAADSLTVPGDSAARLDVAKPLNNTVGSQPPSVPSTSGARTSLTSPTSPTSKTGQSSKRQPAGSTTPQATPSEESTS